MTTSKNQRTMSENKAPKKIYINSDYSNALQMDKDLWVESDISNHKTGYCTVPYILESEHNRIVEELKAELSTSNDLLKMTSDISEYRLNQVTELKKHLQLLLASMDGELDAKRMEHGESYPESEYSINAKKYLKSIK